MIHISAKILLSPFDLKFRLHTWLSREPWAKLWYCLRALDQSGKGYYQIPIELLEALTGGDEKTIYRWLKDGRSAGAFRRYKVRGGILYIWLGGLYAVCQKMNLKHWGAVAVVNLLDLGSIRQLTTATATQRLQQRSHYAANSNLKKKYRKLYGAPHANELLENIGQSSLKSAAGQVPFVLHISKKRVFVSKNFVAFGTSQRAISIDLGIHPKTVQRHQDAMGIVKRQLCQAKYEYSQIKQGLDNEASELRSLWDAEGRETKYFGYSGNEETTFFMDGVTMGAKKSGAANSWNMPAGELPRRLFAISNGKGKGKRYFLAKCNIYREEMTLTAMSASRKAFRQRLAKLAQGNVTAVENDEPPGGSGLLQAIPG